jgi:LacI family transcriptional regulator
MKAALPALADVARQAGVSMSTASRALNPDSTHPVNEATRARVAAVAARLEYQPNPSARNLRMPRLSTVAVLVHDIADPYFAEVVRGVTGAASHAGLMTVVCSTERDPAIELRYIDMLRRSRVPAVLFAGGGLEDAEYQREVNDHARAIVAYGGAVVALAPRAERWPAEVPDNRDGAVKAARYVVGLGHRKVAIIAGPKHLRTSQERMAGYLAVFKEAGVEPLIVSGDFTQAGGQAAVRRMLGTPVTAVLACNDLTALGALDEFRRAGVAVPEEVSVVGFDDIPGLEYIHPALTTVRVPMAQIGAAGVARALAILDGKGTSDRRAHVQPVSLIERNSTARPRARTQRAAARV